MSHGDADLLWKLLFPGDPDRDRPAHESRTPAGVDDEIGVLGSLARSFGARELNLDTHFRKTPDVTRRKGEDEVLRSFRAAVGRRRQWQPQESPRPPDDSQWEMEEKCDWQSEPQAGSAQSRIRLRDQWSRWCDQRGWCGARRGDGRGAEEERRGSVKV
ncbi:hypothetical protein GN956_G15645 [Arapaima gigas]